jgi:uncharacterized protein (DUF1697 family)
MKTCISILRGINVGAQKKILMVDLKALYESLKFKDVITYIQSGNVIFKTSETVSDEALSQKIEKAIAKKYGFEVPVIVRSVAEIDKVLGSNPFLKDKKKDVTKMHVTFLSEAPGKAELEAIKKFDYAPDEFVIAGKDVYLYTPGGYGETKLSNKFFETKLKVTATTRNWNTVNKLKELSE